MSRTLNEIYTTAKQVRDSRLELTEISNSSKMSVLDAFTWVASVCIWSFENILDVFVVDLAKDLNARINGTPTYFANALLKYQQGDDLVMSDDGTSFSYANVDATKRIISRVAYNESVEEGFHDTITTYKVAKGEPGSYERLSSEELVGATKYLEQILFAGQHATLVSRKGDILILNLVVYYDGTVEGSFIYDNIRKNLNEFIKNMNFNGLIYSQKIIDCIQSVDHVVDVVLDSNTSEHPGIYVVQFDDDDNVINGNTNPLKRMERRMIPNGGYIRESSGSGDDAGFKKWDESIELVVENSIVE